MLLAGLHRQGSFRVGLARPMARRKRRRQNFPLARGEKLVPRGGTLPNRHAEARKRPGIHRRRQQRFRFFSSYSCNKYDTKLPTRLNTCLSSRLSFGLSFGLSFFLSVCLSVGLSASCNFFLPVAMFLFDCLF